MSVSNHVTITISTSNVQVTRIGFGIPLIISHTAAWVERVRSYTDLTGVVADFASTTSPEYLAAQALFGQSPRPPTIKIGRAALQPTQVYRITPLAQDSHPYRVTCKGDGVTAEQVTYTSDASATVAEITLGVTTAMNLVVGKNFTAVDDTTHITVTGDAAAEWFSLEVSDNVNMKTEQLHADPGIATDLAAIVLEDDDWYCLLTNFNSNAYVIAAAAWVNAVKKIYVVDVNETDALNTAVDVGSDTLDDLETSAYGRVAGCYHQAPFDMFSASWVGACLPQNPGSITWKFFQLTGPAATTLTSTQRTNLINRSANFYQTAGGLDVTQEGTTSDGDFIDVQRGIDWIEDDMSAGIYAALVAAKKVPFTDPGISSLVSEMRSTIRRASVPVTREILAVDPAPVFSIPKVADISTANKNARILPDLAVSATLAGAIHKVNVAITVTA